MILLGAEKQAAFDIVRANHYAKSVPSGKTIAFGFHDAIVLYSIPANRNISTFLLGKPNAVWELSRLWAPDGHENNLLTRAISETVNAFRNMYPDCDALVSYADPNVGHHGGVYRAASWIYKGQCEESRYYRDANGTTVSRRAFHSGSKGMTKAQIEALGYEQLKLPGKHRFVKPLNRKARKFMQNNR